MEGVYSSNRQRSALADVPLLYPPGELLAAQGGSTTIPPLDPAAMALGPNNINGHQVQLTQPEIDILRAPRISSQWTRGMLRVLAHHYRYADVPVVADHGDFLWRLFCGL